MSKYTGVNLINKVVDTINDINLALAELNKGGIIEGGKVVFKIPLSKLNNDVKELNNLRNKFNEEVK